MFPTLSGSGIRGHPRTSFRAALLGLLVLASSGDAGAAEGATEWRVTEGAAGGGRYSELAQIHPGNVADLEVAWTYRHGDVRERERNWWTSHTYSTGGEGTPLLVDGRLIATTPYNRVIALDPETGAEQWSFDPEIDLERRYANMLINRGVAYWDGDSRREVCGARILLATLDARLIAIDAASGRPCADFGEGGTIDLTQGVDGIVDPWEYNMTSPPTIVGDVVVVGSSIADFVRRLQPSGVVRGYDVRTGQLAWRFDTIPREGEPGTETWEEESWRVSGGANVWSTMVADPERGLVFLPVSAAGPDFFGGDRPGANLYSDSLVALDGRSGKMRWHFQTVHHDLWDYDLAAPPTLVSLPRNGEQIPAVAIATKSGLLFVLDRETGQPLFPVEERPVPQSYVPSEQSHPTQPFPVRPPPLVSHHLGEDDLWNRDPEHFAACRERLRGMRNEGPFTPPSVRGSLVYPGTTGGANWSGSAYDPENNRLFLPVNDWPYFVRLDPTPAWSHGISSLKILDSLVSATLWYATGIGTGLRYAMVEEPFAIDGVPCKAPPWGWMVAVDLTRGSILWRVPVGREDEIEGLRNFGPALATASGLIFHGGTSDARLRALDADTGETLASFDLPAGLHGGPITYRLSKSGPQFVVVAPGGHPKIGSPVGDWIIAYRLPQ